MTSSISSSERLGHGENAVRLAWRRWLVVFCCTFFGVGGVLFTLLLLIDPYDTGRFPNLGIVGVADLSPRTADASRGRDPQFNASVIGNSTGQLLDPYRLSRETGLRFNQLTIPATGPREQLAIMRWVISNHPAYGAFVVVTETTWCSPDPDLPLKYGFPFWLYGDDRAYLANVLNSKSLDRAVWRIQVALGMRRPVDPVGYFNYLEDSKAAFVPDPPTRPPEEMGPVRSLPALPWIDRLREFLAGLPPNVRVAVVMPPVYFTLLPQPGSKRAALIDACKTALAKAVPDRPGSGFLDFHVDNEAAHDPADFGDLIHYRDKLAHQMEARIIALLRSGGIGTAQANDGASRTAVREAPEGRSP